MERGNDIFKKLDLYVGIPLVLISAALRKPAAAFQALRSDPHFPKRIGVLSVAAIGDTVLASAILHALKEKYPDCELTLFTSSGNSGVAALIDACDVHQTLVLTAPLNTISKIRSAQLDWLIDVTPWPRLTAFYAAASGAARTVGFRTKGQFRHYPFDFSVAHRNDRHQLDNIRDLLVPLGITSTALPRLVAANSRPIDLPVRSYVVFHAWPGGYRSEFKRWPEKYWIELGTLAAKEGRAIVLTGSKADTKLSSKLAHGLSNEGIKVFDCAGVCTLLETAALLRDSAAVVSVDTGILHISASLGAPTIGLYGPSPSRRWGAVGPRAIAIDSPGEDCGFLNLGFEYPQSPPHCMKRIAPDEVWTALEKLLDSSASLL